MAYKQNHTSKYEAIVNSFTISGFAAAILDSSMALDLIGLHHFVALPYLGKVTEAFHSTPSGLEFNYSQKTGLG